MSHHPMIVQIWSLSKGRTEDVLRFVTIQVACVASKIFKK